MAGARKEERRNMEKQTDEEKVEEKEKKKAKAFGSETSAVRNMEEDKKKEFKEKIPRRWWIWAKMEKYKNLISL